MKKRTAFELAKGFNYFLFQTWTRPYQVLPERTHPVMVMHGASGYILSGIVVDSPYSAMGL